MLKTRFRTNTGDIANQMRRIDERISFQSRWGGEFSDRKVRQLESDKRHLIQEEDAKTRKSYFSGR